MCRPCLVSYMGRNTGHYFVMYACAGAHALPGIKFEGAAGRRIIRGASGGWAQPVWYIPLAVQLAVPATIVSCTCSALEHVHMGGGGRVRWKGAGCKSCIQGKLACAPAARSHLQQGYGPQTYT